MRLSGFFSPMEARRAVDGLLRLMNSDPGGLALIDSSPRGFLRSFLAFLWCWPAQAFLSTALWRTVEGTRPETLSGMIGYFLTGSAFNIVSWLATPLILYPVSGLFGFRNDYLRLIVVSNWFSLIAVYISFLPATIGYLAPVPPGAVALTNLVCFGLSILLYFRVVRVVLAGEAMLAALVTLISLTSSLFISELAWRALGL